MKPIVSNVKTFFIVLMFIFSISSSYSSPTETRSSSSPTETRSSSSPTETRSSSHKSFREQVKSRKPRVINGNNAKISEYPWMLSVFRSGSHMCGATLISPQWVLTAAHCVSENKNYTLYIGPNKNLEDPYENLDDYTVETIETHVHPNFITGTAVSKGNDIALLKLKKPIFSITPVNLNENKNIANDQMVKALGWGRRSIDGSGTWDKKLQELNLQTYSKDKCNMPYSETMICAGSRDSTTGTCSGDSGSPILVKGTSHHWDTQIGINSFNYFKNGKCALRLNSMFTNVAYYKDFIHEYTRKFSAKDYSYNSSKSHNRIHILGDTSALGLKVTVRTDLTLDSDNYLELYSKTGRLIKRYQGKISEEFYVYGEYIKVALVGKQSFSNSGKDISVEVTPVNEHHNFINDNFDIPYFLENKNSSLVWGTGEYGKGGEYISPTLSPDKNNNSELLWVTINLNSWEYSNSNTNNDTLILYDENNNEIKRIHKMFNESFAVQAKTISAKLFADNEGGAKGVVVSVAEYDKNKHQLSSWYSALNIDKTEFLTPLLTVPGAKIIRLITKVSKNTSENGYQLTVYNEFGKIINEIHNHKVDELLVQADAIFVKITAHDGNIIRNASATAHEMKQDSKLQSLGNYKNSPTYVKASEAYYTWFLNNYEAGTDIISLPLEITKTTGQNNIYDSLWVKVYYPLQEDEFIILYDENLQEFSRFNKNTYNPGYSTIPGKKVYARLILKNATGNKDFYIRIVGHDTSKKLLWMGASNGINPVIESPELTIPGNKSLKIHIKGNTKSREDFVSLYDHQGIQVRRFSGLIDDYFYIAGDTVKAVLTTGSKHFYPGFQIEVSPLHPLVDYLDNKSTLPTASYSKSNDKYVWTSGSYSPQEIRETPLMAFIKAKWLSVGITGKINKEDSLILYSPSGHQQANLNGEINHCVYMPFSGVQAELHSSEKSPLEGLNIIVLPYEYESCTIPWPDDACQGIQTDKPHAILIVGAKELAISSVREDIEVDDNTNEDDTNNILSNQTLSASLSENTYNIITSDNLVRISFTEGKNISQPISPFSIAVSGWEIIPENSIGSTPPPLSLPGQEFMEVLIAGQTQKNQDFLTVVDESNHQIKRVSGTLSVQNLNVKGDCIRFSMTPGLGNWLDIKVAEPSTHEKTPDDVYQVSDGGRKVKWQVWNYSKNEERLSPPISVKLDDEEWMFLNLASKEGPHYVEVIDNSGETLQRHRGKYNYNLKTREMGVTVILRTPYSSTGLFLEVNAIAGRDMSTTINSTDTVILQHPTESTNGAGSALEVSGTKKVLILIIIAGLLHN